MTFSLLMPATTCLFLKMYNNSLQNSQMLQTHCGRANGEFQCNMINLRIRHRHGEEEKKLSFLITGHDLRIPKNTFQICLLCHTSLHSKIRDVATHFQFVFLTQPSLTTALIKRSKQKSVHVSKSVYSVLNYLPCTKAFVHTTCRSRNYFKNFTLVTEPESQPLTITAVFSSTAIEQDKKVYCLVSVNHLNHSLCRLIILRLLFFNYIPLFGEIILVRCFNQTLSSKLSLGERFQSACN